MQYQLLFVRGAQTGGVTYANGVVPPIPAVGQTVEFAVDGAVNTFTAGVLTGISYNYQDTTGQLIVITLTVQ